MDMTVVRSVLCSSDPDPIPIAVESSQQYESILSRDAKAVELSPVVLGDESVTIMPNPTRYIILSTSTQGSGSNASFGHTQRMRSAFEIISDPPHGFSAGPTQMIPVSAHSVLDPPLITEFESNSLTMTSPAAIEHDSLEPKTHGVCSEEEPSLHDTERIENCGDLAFTEHSLRGLPPECVPALRHDSGLELVDCPKHMHSQPMDHKINKHPSHSGSTFDPILQGSSQQSTAKDSHSTEPDFNRNESLSDATPESMQCQAPVEEQDLEHLTPRDSEEMALEPMGGVPGASVSPRKGTSAAAVEPGRAPCEDDYRDPGSPILAHPNTRIDPNTGVPKVLVLPPDLCLDCGVAMGREGFNSELSPFASHTSNDFYVGLLGEQKIYKSYISTSLARDPR
ncbi:hypothetical protein M011DRAFT_463084 [Sporormia fimetaria CBS 119925]|uniref:Uncharacterized protein n=1 Tax=Sporormia fimetaria CBS 119925 TaxID=1340428 RepID=A0A6A6UX31_9PLEO|nr:hypothetical protein M011DRAFT_463084 [Sporormia fimetaria CBS 119925]